MTCISSFPILSTLVIKLKREPTMSCWYFILASISFCLRSRERDSFFESCQWADLVCSFYSNDLSFGIGSKVSRCFLSGQENFSTWWKNIELYSQFPPKTSLKYQSLFCEGLSKLSDGSFNTLVSYNWHGFLHHLDFV